LVTDLVYFCQQPLFAKKKTLKFVGSGSFEKKERFAKYKRLVYLKVDVLVNSRVLERKKKQIIKWKKKRIIY